MLTKEDNEPGLLMSTEVIAEDDSGYRGMRLSECFAGEIPHYEWVPAKHFGKKKILLAQYNDFVEVESVYVRPARQDEALLELSVDFSRRVVVTANYPCAVAAEGMHFLGHVPAGRLTTSHLVPMSRPLLIWLPYCYRSGLGAGPMSLLTDLRKKRGLKEQFAAVNMSQILSIIPVMNARGSARQVAGADYWIGEGPPMETRIMRLRLKNADMLITSSGIVLFS